MIVFQTNDLKMCNIILVFKTFSPKKKKSDQSCDEFICRTFFVFAYVLYINIYIFIWTTVVQNTIFFFEIIFCYTNRDGFVNLLNGDYQKIEIFKSVVRYFIGAFS